MPTAEDARLAPDPVDAPFLLFVAGVGERFGSVIVFARVVGEGEADERLLLPAGTRVVSLPDYGNLRRVPALLKATWSTGVAFWRGLRDVDVVWAFGPHPFQLLLVALARLRGRRVVLGVRQDTRAYFRARLPNARWKPLVPALDLMEAIHRLAARRLPATVVGAENLARYGARGRILAMTPSLVRSSDVLPAPPHRDWDGEIGLLTVGRIDAEKNPLLLVELMAELERLRPARFRLDWVGVGAMEDAVRRRAAELGVDDRLSLVGYVPFGPRILDFYRRAHVFVHVSLTEGAPQVLVEAMASGTPIVATDVGGVRGALDGGRAGVLVPPRDLAALSDAVLALTDDAGVRERLARTGLEHARTLTLEAESERVARFLRDAGAAASPI